MKFWVFLMLGDEGIWFFENGDICCWYIDDIINSVDDDYGFGYICL